MCMKCIKLMIFIVLILEIVLNDIDFFKIHHISYTDEVKIKFKIL